MVFCRYSVFLNIKGKSSPKLRSHRVSPVTFDSFKSVFAFINCFIRIEITAPQLIFMNQVAVYINCNAKGYHKLIFMVY